MTNQSFIEKLGFEASDKVVILHIDDIGFSHASNIASFECLDFGVASCGSILVPAPWFLEVASICRKNSNVTYLLRCYSWVIYMDKNSRKKGD